MNKLFDALMAVITSDDVTPVTRVTPAEVTPKPAWIKAVTPVTPVTPAFNEGGQESERQTFKRHVHALVAKGVISRQEGDDLVKQHFIYPDLAETRLHNLASIDRMRQYHAHHFGCAKCIAAGRGYGTRCTTGLRLWSAGTEHFLTTKEEVKP